MNVAISTYTSNGCSRTETVEIPLLSLATTVNVTVWFPDEVSSSTVESLAEKL